MCAGDFVEVYGAPDQAGRWNAVATCFFIDTAHNVVEYLEIIARCLRPGGVWVNFGPLLFHWADASSYLGGDEMSMEMSLEDIERHGVVHVSLTHSRTQSFISHVSLVYSALDLRGALHWGIFTRSVQSAVAWW